MRARRFTPFFLLAALAACDQAPSPTAVESFEPGLSIVDARHNDGNERFVWLPPLVSDPRYTGEFDSALAPVVEICQWTNGACVMPLLASFSTTTGAGSETVRVDPDAGHYEVNWHTNDFDLDPLSTYRIVVRVDGVSFGHADVDVVSSGKELKNVDTQHFIALKDGRTLPIKFRIDRARLHLPSVLITSNREGDLDVYAMNPDGSGAVNLTQHAARDEEGSWSPDGTEIVFTSTRAGQTDLYRTDLLSGTVTRITNTVERERTPSFSPDGSRILFDVFRSNGTGDVVVMNADGTGRVQLTTSPQEDRAPSWSPDGQTIAFHRQTAVNTDIWLMNADGTNQRNVTASALIYNSTASWTADGTAFYSAAGTSGSGTFGLFRVDATSGASTEVTPRVAGRRDANPVLAPDGASLLFTSNRAALGEPVEVFRLELSNGSIVQVTSAVGFSANSDWR